MSDEDEQDGNNEDSEEEFSFDVYVVRDGEPVTGEEVTASFSYAFWPGATSSEYTDRDGHASFSSTHPSTPLSVEIFVDGTSRGTYSLEEGAGFTVDLSD